MKFTVRTISDPSEILHTSEETIQSKQYLQCLKEIYKTHVQEGVGILLPTHKPV
jgi:hypothetical protein